MLKGWDPHMIPCYCSDSVYKLVTSRTPKNPGRDFVTCATKSCDFWCWVDELCICQCQKGFCKVRASTKSYNKGRRFYCCPESTVIDDSGCKFFKWIDSPSVCSSKQNLVETSLKEKKLEENCDTVWGSSEKTVEDKPSSFKQERRLKEKLLLEIEVERRATQRQSELCSSILEKFGGFKI